MHINAGIITVSDRASKGLYDDLGGPALKQAAAAYGWKSNAPSVSRLPTAAILFL